MTEVSKMQPVVPYLYPFGASVRVKHVQVLNPNDFSCLPDCCTSAVPKRIFFFKGSFILVVHFVSSLSLYVNIPFGSPLLDTPRSAGGSDKSPILSFQVRCAHISKTDERDRLILASGLTSPDLISSACAETSSACFWSLPMFSPRNLAYCDMTTPPSP